MIHLHPSKVMHVCCAGLLLRINQMWFNMQKKKGGRAWDVNTLPQETVNQKTCLHTFSELMDLTDVAVIGPLKAPQSGKIQTCSLFIYGLGEIDAGKVQRGVWGGNTKYTKETVLFDKDQRELLGGGRRSVFTSPWIQTASPCPCY